MGCLLSFITNSPNCPNCSSRGNHPSTGSPEIRLTRITARDATVGRAGFVESEGHHQAIVLVTGILESKQKGKQKRVRRILLKTWEPTGFLHFEGLVHPYTGFKTFIFHGFGVQGKSLTPYRFACWVVGKNSRYSYTKWWDFCLVPEKSSRPLPIGLRVPIPS